MAFGSTIVPLPKLSNLSHVTSCCQLLRVASDLTYQRGPLGSRLKALFSTNSFKEQKKILEGIINLTNAANYNNLTVRIYV